MTTKKILSALLCCVGLGAPAFAAGTVNWNAFSPAAMTAQTNATVFSTFGDLPGGPDSGSVGLTQGHPPSGPAFYWTLLYAPFNGSQLATPTSWTTFSSQGWQSSGLLATNSNVSGRLSPVNPSTAATVPWGAGATNSIMMAGWSANLGTTWGAVSTELAQWNLYGPALTQSNFGERIFFGLSTTGYIAPFDNVNPGAILFGALPNVSGLPINSLNTQLYEIISIPEPSTLALAGLGGLGWLLACRRHKG